MSNSALVLVASVIIIGNFVSLYLFRWVHKNKYKVGDYVYIRTAERLFVARIDSIVWESNIPDLIDRPTYNVYYCRASSIYITINHLLKSGYKDTSLTLAFSLVNSQ